MGIKGKLIGRLKRRPQQPSDESINTTTSATTDVVPTTMSREKYSVIDPSPTPPPVTRAAVDLEIPLTPGTMKNSSDDEQVSPDHTTSTLSWSVKSDVLIWDANEVGRDIAVPSLIVEERPDEWQQAEEKNIFTDGADKAYKSVKKGSIAEKEVNINHVEISDEKSVKLVNSTKVAASSEVEEDPHGNILPEEAVHLTAKPNQANSTDRKLVEVPCDPIGFDDPSGETPATAEKTLSDRAEGVVARSRSLPKENVDSTASKVTQVGRGLNKGTVDRKAGEMEGMLEEKNVSKSKKGAGTAAEEKSKTRPASPVKPSIHEKAAATSQEEGNVPNGSSLMKAILTNLPSDEESTRSRKVSFHESRHVSGLQSQVEEGDDSSYDSEEEYDDDSHYYDDHEGDDFDDDQIDEATHVSADSMVLNHDDGGIWGWLCGYDNYSTSPNSIADKSEEKSFATVVSDDGRESVISADESVDTNEGASMDEGEEMSHREEAFRVRQSSGSVQSSASRAHKLRAVPSSTRMPSLLKKTIMKQEGAIVDQPRDSQGFQLDENKSTKSKSSISRGEKVGKKEHIKKDDASITSASYKQGRRQGSSKDTRQLEIYCKQHGGVENLVVRKYPSAPLPAGRNHILVKVEASTVSSRDCLLRLQGDPNQEPSPSVPGFQIVGTIFALGLGLKSNDVLRRGDRVAALTNGGGNARYIFIPASDAILLPPTATHEGLICLVSNYMTAYQSLKLAKMKKGGAPLTNCNVLITGGSGPVGQALIDLASREGARVITTAHQMHAEHLTKNLGAEWFPVNPKQWLPTLEGQMDVVVDSLCVDGYESSYRALAPDGVLICTGNMSANSDNDSATSIFESKSLQLWWSDLKAKHVWKNCFFYNIYESYQNDPKLFRQELLYLYLQLESGNIKPKIAGRVSLNQVPKAQKLIEKGLPNGTVILNPWKRLDPRQMVPIEKCDFKRT